MTRQERANYVLETLESLYPVVDPPLTHTDPYTLLVAVLLSAQCTDERVNKVTPDLFKLADNPRDMARKKPATIEKIIKPCGLSPRKSKAIHALSNILINDYDGEVPQDMAALETLPGVGHKTASVVMSQAFGEPAFAVDTHIHRCAQLWKLTNGKNVVQTENDLKKLFPRETWSKVHLQIIFYGREYCSARGCRGLVCGICTTLFPNRKNPVVTKK